MFRIWADISPPYKLTEVAEQLLAMEALECRDLEPLEFKDVVDRHFVVSDNLILAQGQHQ